MSADTPFLATTALATAMAAIAAGANVYIAKLVYRATHRNEKCRLYLALRERYTAARCALPNELFSDTSSAAMAKGHERAIEQYWWTVYDEWYTTTKLTDGKFIKLWTDHYKDALRNTLKSPVMQQALLDMWESQSHFGDERIFEFVSVLGLTDSDDSADQARIANLKPTRDQVGDS